MKTKTINLYEYSELSKEAKANALYKWNEYNDDPLMQSHMINLLKEELDERGIQYDDSIDVRYSLSSSQGDGLMFLGEFVWKRYTIYITHNNSNYYHTNTAYIDLQETNNLEYYMDDEHTDVIAFQNMYIEICNKLEKIGYAEIEYQQSEESFEGACEANEYSFREDGTMENN